MRSFAVSAAQDDARHDAIAVALLLLIEAALFADVIAGSGVFFFRDFSRYYFPVKKIQREIVLAGEFPFWTRAYSAGQPLAANPEHETFYPLNWLILLPGYVGALHLQALLHLAIGLVAMYAFLRSMRLHAFPCFIGALSFGLGGAMLSKINMAPFLYSAAWLPLTCLYARKYVLEGTRRSFVLAVICLALQLLIGEPTTVLQTAMILGGYAAWHAYQSRQARPLLRIAAIGFVAMLLAAAQFFPAIDFVRDSARARPFPLEVVGQWSMPWARLLELVFPNILGHHFGGDTTVFWAAGLYGASSVPFFLSIYPGLLVTALAAAGFVSRSRGAGMAAAVCVGSIVLAAGLHTPILHLLYEAGLVRTFRYPEKFVLIAIFAITVFAAHCLDALQRGDEHIVRAGRWVAIVLTAIPLALFVWSLTPGYAAAFARVFALDPVAASFTVPVSRYDWLVAALRGAAVLLLIWTARKATHRPIWMLVAIATLLIDFARLTPEIAPRLAPSLYDTPAIPEALRDDRYRLFHQAQWGPDRVVAGDLARRTGAAPRPHTVPPTMRFRDVAAIQYGFRNGLFPFLPAAWGVQTVIEHDVDATNLLPTVDFRRGLEIAARTGGMRAVAAAMAMSNARFRAVYREQPPESPNDDPALVQPVAFIETTRQPRYYFGSPVVSIRGVEDFAAKLASGAYPPSVAFVSEPMPLTGSGAVRSVVETANGATIDVDAAGQAFLVMSVTPHRYWRLFVDGVRVPAIATNIGYQGVVVPAGRHRVTMTYRNPIVIAGGVISVLTGIGLALWWLRFSPRPA